MLRGKETEIDDVLRYLGIEMRTFRKSPVKLLWRYLTAQESHRSTIVFINESRDIQITGHSC